MSHSTVVRAADIRWQNLEARDGVFVKVMTFGDDAARRSMRAQLGRTSPATVSPRHKHTFDQLWYIIEGDAKFGNTIYRPGDCVYVPEGVAYGPQAAHNGADTIRFVSQWDGPSGAYYPSAEERRAARNALNATGAFRDGVYYPNDGPPQDGFEALLEYISGTPVTYAAPRYEAPVRMRASAFAAVPDPHDPRISRRRLARFNEGGPDVALVELERGATLPSEVPHADQLSALLGERAHYEGRDIESVSCVHVPFGAQREPLTATEDCTVLIVTFG
jgi:mannose-6-phosphate isomerase-like protein (cupin superfamily)